MSEDEKESQTSKDQNSGAKTEESKPKKKKKAKFTFKCTRCDECCMGRGPIPLTMWDLELWAKNGVLANFMPYIDVYNKPDGGMDLILKPLPPEKEEKKENAPPEEAFKDVPVQELLDEKCPLYDKGKSMCLVYENRPLSCRTYPLEYDGKNYSIVDLDCPGVGEPGMTKEELKEMKETAQKMHHELTRMRIGLPVMNQIISQNFMKTLMKQQMEAMSKMSEEDKEKLNEIMSKTQPEVPEPPE
jgi:Fe-S-cluster containining protein